MRWLRARSSLATVIGINLGWLLVALVSSPKHPIGPWLWHGEGSAVEILEVALTIGCIGAWGLIAWRLRAPGPALPRVLAALMVVQLVVLIVEELDVPSALGFGHRNLRQALRGIVPDILDTPTVSAFLLLFLLVPLLPVARIQSWLERARPVRAERADAWAVVVGLGLSVPIWLAVPDIDQGELQQLVVYAVLAIVTARILGSIRAP